MPKSKAGKSKGYISSGKVPTISKKHKRLMKPSADEQFMNKFRAWIKGHDPWITIQNPNKTETNKPFIKVRASQYFADRKPYWMKAKTDEVTDNADA